MIKRGAGELEGLTDIYQDDDWAKTIRDNMAGNKSIKFRYKGSSSSGYHGHAGRPGKVGGSAPKGATGIMSMTTDVNSVPMRHYTSESAKAGILKNGFRLSENSMYGQGVYFSDTPAYGDPDTFVEIGLKPHKQLVVNKDTDVDKAYAEAADTTPWDSNFRRDMLNAGYGSVRIHSADPDEPWIWTLVLDPNLIQITGSKGSSRSGNYAHAGRPGKVGGSAPQSFRYPVMSSVSPVPSDKVRIGGKTGAEWMKAQAAVTKTGSDKLRAQLAGMDLEQADVDAFLDKLNAHRANVMDETLQTSRSYYLSSAEQKELMDDVVNHDNDKYDPDVAIPYITRHDPETGKLSKTFWEAQRSHTERSPHHPEYWEIEGTDRANQMPTTALIELVSDWKATANYFGDPPDQYYRKNGRSMVLHPNTREAVERELGIRRTPFPDKFPRGYFSKELTLKFRYKGSSRSGNYGHAGRPGKVGGSSPKGAVISPTSLAIMKRYANEQAWNEPIREYMEANGLSIDDYQKAKQVLYHHNIRSGVESDKDLSDLWNSDAPEGAALRAMSVWQEWQVKNVPDPVDPYAANHIANVKDKITAMDSKEWSKWRSWHDGGNLCPTPERYIQFMKAKARGERLYYRKGGLDHAALSTTQFQNGAISGTSQFIPDRFYTFDELKAAGYHLISGARGMVGVTSADEGEHIWLKPLESTKELTLKFRYKGSSRSGNYGHAGRPGKVGGSSPKGSGITGAYIKAKYTNIDDMNLPILKRQVDDDISRVDAQDLASEVFKAQGFDGKPDVIDLAQMQTYVANGETAIYRGITGSGDMAEAQKRAEQFRTGELFVGHGLSGSGTYVARNASMAEDYASPNDGVVMSMTLREDAKVIGRSDLNKMMAKERKDFEDNHTAAMDKLWDDRDAGKIDAATFRAERERLNDESHRFFRNYLWSDDGTFAAIRGYDAVDCGWGFIIMNRTALRVLDKNNVSASGARLNE